jgi:tetratricopeptide (TPR) repeat protein
MKRQGPAGLGVDEAQFKTQLGVALLVVSQYADAVPLLEEAHAAAGDDTWAAPLAIAYAGVGRTKEAMELYARTEENLGNAYYLAAALANTRQWEAVLDLLSRFSDNQSLQRLALVADISIKTGLGEDYRALFRKALATHGREALRDFYPRFLKANDLFADAAATNNLRNDPLLVQVLADLFARPDTVREPWRDAVRQALEQSADADPEAAYTFAAALEAGNDLEAAVSWYGKAVRHPEQRDDRMRQACERILAIAAPEQAHSILAPLVSIHPDLLVHVDDLLSFLLERDGAGLETTAAAWPADTIPDASFLQGLIAHALHDDTVAGDALMTSALGGELDDDHVGVLIDALEYKRALDPLRNLAKTLAQRNRSARQQRTALRACLVLALAQQRYDIAARSAAEVFLVDRHYWQVAHGLTVQLTPPQDVPLIRSQLEMLLREAPSHPRAPHLLILSADLATAAGEPIDAVTLSQSLAMPDATTRRTRAWKNMVCAWMVAGPEPLAERDLNMSSELPPNLKASLLPDAYVPPFPRGWRTGELNPVMAQIEFAEALGLDEDATDRMFGYAITEIVSPDERTATFAIGSDAWSYMWLNGDLVHWNYDNRAAIVDQDIIELRLRPGRNRFVAKVGNDMGPWEFSLSILEGGDGLEVALPPPVLPQRDPEMENPATVE